MKVSSILLVLLPLAVAANFYDKSSHIVELNPGNFDEIVKQTNHTTIVEFYAPWCGYCKQLKPVYKKLSKLSKDLFQVAAVNCDDASNKKLCADHKVEGFPTLTVFRPMKMNPMNPQANQGRMGKCSPDVYHGKRDLKPMMDFTLGRIKNYVKRLHSGSIDKFISSPNPRGLNKVVLLTEKHGASPFLKSLAIDFLDTLEFAYLPLADQSTLEKFGITTGDSSLPVVLVVDDSQKVHVYKGENTKLEISRFLAEFGTPQEGALSGKGCIYSRNGRRLHDEL